MKTISLLLSGSAALLACSIAETAAAQTDGARRPTDSALEEVVVTGTRVLRNGYQAPTPLTVVGEEMLQKRAPSTLIDALVSLPSLKNVSTQSTAGSSVAGSAGQSFVNLRGLGPNRTLVLLDGKRIVPTRETAAVDISILPSGLIERVEVVTGGASAAWGSDAVAGVVNFILDKDFTGFKGDVQAGVTTRGDGKNGKLSLTYGSPVFADRGHLLLSGEYYQNDGVPANSRWWADSAGVINNPAYAPGNGQYRVLLAPHLYWTHPPEGLINSGPLKGTSFGPDGTPRPYNYCNYAGTSFQACDTALFLPSTPYYSMISVAQTRGTGFGRLSYDLTSNAVVYGEALYGNSKTEYFSGAPSSFISGNFTIQRDNAFLPESVRTRMVQAGVTSFPLSRSFNDFGWSPASREVTTKRFVAGLDATVWDNWTLRASYEMGRSRNRFELSNNALIGRFRSALDAVLDPATGRVVCRSTLASPTNGCVPINAFIENTNVDAAKGYVMGTSQSILRLGEDAAQFSLSGEPFSIWAGPVSLAFGGEYRRETANQTADAQSTASLFALANPKPLKGRYTAREVFAETVVPLLKDQPLVRSLDLNAAVRYTDYSTSGQVTTWKVGATYEPIEDVRLRFTRSRDIRAPNLLELFASSVQSTGSVSDPVTNRQYSFQAFSLGNPDLAVETADTTAAGIVYRPGWLSGFNASVDYYRIELRDAIQTIGLQDIVNRCAGGNATLCGLITRDAAQVITGINSRYLNLTSIKTDGFDIDASYRFPLSNVNADLAGDVSLQALGSYVGKYSVSDGVNVRDQAGSLADGQPKWNWNFIATYALNPVTVFLNAVYISGGTYSTQYTQPLDIDRNTVKSWTALNGSVHYDLGHDRVVYLAVDNITDQAPPMPFWSNGGNYDRVGRRYRFGLRFRY